MTRARNEALLRCFADVLRELRLKLGLTQEELAYRADVDRTFIGKLEGARSQPSLVVLFGIAQAMGIAPGELLNLVERKFTQT